MNDSGYLVVIEWDGKKPPTAFYHRVRSLTSGVRQNDSDDARTVSPFARRAERNETAVIMQEGAIYCSSNSLARALTLLAEEYGASSVELATVSKMAPVVATTEDIAALARISKTLGRRGRPPVKRNRWITITCYEEVGSKSFRTSDEIVNCPSCGSLSIEVHYPGKKIDTGVWSPAISHSLFESWLVRRSLLNFTHSGFLFLDIQYTHDEEELKEIDFYREPYGSQINGEPSLNMYSYSSASASIQARVAKMPTLQRDIVDVMAHSDLNFLDKLYLYPEIIIRVLDAIFVGRYKVGEEERLEGRISALSFAMVRYPEIAGDYLLALSDDKVDFFDAAPIIPTKEMLDIFTAIHTARERKKVAA